MGVALRVVFWAAVAALAASAGLTVAGGAFNLEALLAAGIVGWFAGCLLLFGWTLLLAFRWLRSRRPGKSGDGGGRKPGAG